MPAHQNQGKIGLGCLPNQHDLPVNLLGGAGVSSQADMVSGLIDCVLEFQFLNNPA